ncbi:MAG: UDP-N-acetylmuramate--L-alanine ligase [Lachnospiraceae bacterium]|nr:UDP-N-acetylmuramate--L-alanine ligase [Lachnospiraceae bacterium]
MADNQETLHVHFMGIMGSGCASIAKLALEQGYRVSGCDTSLNSYYADDLKAHGVKIEEGHDVSHLTDDVDIVAVSPAIFDMNPDNPELKEADKRGILMTWQEFMGKYLQAGKRVVAVSGTHGKTTTTFLTAEILVDAGLDPTVEGGSVYKKWGSGGRAGSSDLFLCEADEFNRNFFHYRPETAVVLSVEMDHPECFRDEEEVLNAFVHFLSKGTKLKNIVLNGDDPGAVEVLKRSLSDPEAAEAETYLFFRDDEKPLPFSVKHYHPAVYSIRSRKKEGTAFTLSLDGREETFTIRIPGDYNVMNAAAAVLTAKILGVSSETIRGSLLSFSGAGRRFDLVGTFRSVPVYDDYAHHPTEIRSVLSMTKTYFPGEKVLAVFEPHQISRLTMMFDGYVGSLTIAEHVIITKTHIGREILKGVVPIAPEVWENASDRIIYEEDPVRIREIASELIEKEECTLIVVIGAANSYKLSRFLVSEA